MSLRPLGSLFFPVLGQYVGHDQKDVDVGCYCPQAIPERRSDLKVPGDTRYSLIVVMSLLSSAWLPCLL